MVVVVVSNVLKLSCVHRGRETVSGRRGSARIVSGTGHGLVTVHQEVVGIILRVRVMTQQTDAVEGCGR